jgi:hypothetical protein
MGHYGLEIDGFRKKIAMVWGATILKNMLNNKAVDEYTVRHKWLKEGGRPAREKIAAICGMIGIEPEDFNKEADRFAVTLTGAIEALTGRKINAEDLMKKGQRLLDSIGSVEKSRTSGSEYLVDALKPLKGVTKERIRHLYEKFKGTYYLYHYAISPKAPGEPVKISRAILTICDVEDSFMCVSVKWPDNNEEYRGIIAIGNGKWYFKLGSDLSHEIAQMVTFDPSSVVMSKKRLHGILMGCTETYPQIPSAVKALMIKVDDDSQKRAVNLDADDVNDEIKKEISNLIDNDKNFTLQSSVPSRIRS